MPVDVAEGLVSLVVPESLQELLGTVPELHRYMPLAPVRELPGYETFTRPALPERVANLLAKVLNDLALWRENPEATEDADLIALHLMPLVHPSFGPTTPQFSVDLLPAISTWQKRYDELVSRLLLIVTMLAIDPLATALTESGTSSETATDSEVANAVTLIVHGTNAEDKTWWRKDVTDPNNFWAYVDGLTGNCVRPGHEFVWSGGVTDVDRRAGANVLLNWWRSEGEPELKVIAHSHGANVVLQAMAFDRAFSPKSIIALGMPVCFIYPITLAQTDQIHNVYSEYDAIQVPGAWLAGQRGEGRTLPDSQKVTNHHVPYWSPKVWGQRAVGHSDLHDPNVWANHRLDTLL